MPLTIPAGILTKANFIVTYLKPLVDANETAAANAQAAANAASTLAGQKYTKPGGGIPVSDLAPGATNTNWITPANGVWPVRPTSSLSVRYVWLRTSVSDPAVIIGGSYAIAGHDLVAQP